MNQEILTVKEVAKYLRVTPDTVYRLSKRGTIPASKVGRHIRFKREDIEEFLATSKPERLDQD